MRNLLPFIALLLFSFTLLNGNQTDDHIKKFCKEGADQRQAKAETTQPVRCRDLQTEMGQGLQDGPLLCRQYALSRADYSETQTKRHPFGIAVRAAVTMLRTSSDLVPCGFGPLYQ